jgi:hypothetical protein
MPMGCDGIENSDAVMGENEMAVDWCEPIDLVALGGLFRRDKSFRWDSSSECLWPLKIGSFGS